MSNKVLVIGSGGREHAIIYKLKQSPKVSQIFALPGNGGISKLASCINNIKANDHKAIINFCQENNINLVVIGPEQPLIDGLSDDLKAANINVFGPSKSASRLEGSKIFTKEICDKYDIPTAKYKSFDNGEKAINYLNEIEYPIVVKADGIAAGKGVIIAQNEVEAKNAITEILNGKFGEAGNQIVIEEFLDGTEISFFAICDGKKAKFFGSAGDHKKVGEGETGLNTGGMGTYSPSPFVTNEIHKQIEEQIINPTLKGMSELNSPFSGILFAGLILTKNGPKLLEFNTRLGDPEAQTILLRLESDLFDIMNECALENLTSEVKFSDQKAVCVVIAAKGYPGSYKKGTEIKNLEKAENLDENIVIFHAGTKTEEDKTLAVGGRVLGVSAIANDFDLARKNSYAATKTINWTEGFYRRDIALRITQK